MNLTLFTSSHKYSSLQSDKQRKESCRNIDLNTCGWLLTHIVISAKNSTPKNLFREIQMEHLSLSYSEISRKPRKIQKKQVVETWINWAYKTVKAFFRQRKFTASWNGIQSIACGKRCRKRGEYRNLAKYVQGTYWLLQYEVAHTTKYTILWDLG
jgi:hypothetical protein